MLYTAQEFLEHMKTSARLAGDFLKTHTKFSVEEKSDTSFVTEIDTGVQHIILKYLKEQYPDISYIAEEENNESEMMKEHGYQWCIDPIDGTHNFIQGIPYYAISIGLLKNGEPFAGVIYDPSRDEIFVSDTHNDAFDKKSFYTVITGSGHGEVYKSIENSAIQNILKTPHLKYRRFGSAALDLAHLSKGRIDGIMLIGNSLWDYVAGFAILQDRKDIMISKFSSDIHIISRKEIHEILVSIIRNNQ